jgi:hypothetical protein
MRALPVSRQTPPVFLWLITMLASSWPADGQLEGQEKPASTSSIEVQLPSSAGESVSGRLLVLTSRRDGREPRFGPDWFGPEPFFGLEVRDWQPGTTITIDDQADGFPGKLSELPPGEYHVQALLDQDFYHAHPNEGVGNLYSDPVQIQWQRPVGKKNRGGSSSLTLVLDKEIEAWTFPASKWVHEVKIPSPRLSLFHGREVIQGVAVILPPSYEAMPERRYPVLYVVSGFGGVYQRMATRYRNGSPPAGEGETEFIRVLLDGQCKWGHHVYANSATNGPRGAALVMELLPTVDRRFRTVAASTARFVAGHSSGGWSSLWLQFNYPDTFGGVWSTSPDPVDFRDYQQVNLYADPPLSLYTDEHGNRRPLARQGNEPIIWYPSFGKMDDCLGRGGQLRSFEAVFSPLGEDGLPAKLWNREGGRIDPRVARAWENYDINLLLRRRWPVLKDSLAGKIHITTGGLDTFYLEGAVEQLIGTLKELGSDAQVEVVPGKNHGNVITPALRSRERRQMTAAFARHHPEHREAAVSP